MRVAILQAGHRAFVELDPGRIPGLELIVDGRNVLDPVRWRAAGITYVGIGR